MPMGIDCVVIPETTENSIGAGRDKAGFGTCYMRGRCFERMAPGFYQPIALLCPVDSADYKRLSSFTLGVRVATSSEDTSAANGTIPAYLLSDLRGFSLEALPPTRRQAIRKGLRSAQFQLLNEPSALLKEGYIAAQSSYARTGKKVPKYANYCREVVTWFDDGRVVLASYVEGRLVGYIDGFAIDGVGYGSRFIVHTDALQLGVASALLYMMIKAFARSPHVEKMMNGLDTSHDRASLDHFKRSFGFKLVHVPSFVTMAPGVGSFLKWAYPGKYYRFVGTGHGVDHLTRQAEARESLRVS
jgi:hypothetical protein